MTGRLPCDKYTKLQYNHLTLIASLSRVTDEDFLSEIVQYDPRTVL